MGEPGIFEQYMDKIEAVLHEHVKDDTIFHLLMINITPIVASYGIAEIRQLESQVAKALQESKDGKRSDE